MCPNKNYRMDMMKTWNGDKEKKEREITIPCRATIFISPIIKRKEERINKEI